MALNNHFTLVRRWGRDIAAAAALLISMLAAGDASAQLVDNTVRVNMDPASLTVPGNVQGVVGGASAEGARVDYTYVRNDGEDIVDSIPVEFCVLSSVGVPWTSFEVKLRVNKNSGSLPGVTMPANLVFTYADFQSQTGQYCKSTTITINTGALVLPNPAVAKNYTVTIQGLAEKWIASQNFAAKVVGENIIVLHVNVLPAPENTACYMTDSEGYLLENCAGQDVTESGSDDGRFEIVANKKGREVATNPGQFYYNFVWKNRTGTAQVVKISFLRTNVLPHGAQAIHAYVSNAFGSTLTTAQFDEVNSIGVAEGADDLIAAINVPAGDSVYATYHLSYAGIGKTVPVGCATNCPTANQPLYVKATVSGVGIPTEDCESGAWGYRKSE